MSGGAFGEVDAFVVVRDAAADHAHTGCLELIKLGVLAGQCGIRSAAGSRARD